MDGRGTPGTSTSAASERSLTKGEISHYRPVIPLMIRGPNSLMDFRYTKSVTKVQI